MDLPAVFMYQSVQNIKNDLAYTETKRNRL
jgi:hypothetical protein